MQTRRRLLGIFAAIAFLATAIQPAGAAGGGDRSPDVSIAAARRFANCAAMNRVYPHGVGKVGARDRVRGKTKPVTNFYRSNKLYAANAARDRDKDGVACEKR